MTPPRRTRRPATARQTLKALIHAACTYYESATDGSTSLEQAEKYAAVWKTARAYGRACAAAARQET